MKKAFRFLVQHNYKIAGLFILGILLAIFSFSERGESITSRTFDPIRNVSSRSEVAIIAIDDKSLQMYGAWPWNRDIFATLHQKLEALGVKSVAYDVLFFEPRYGDEAFRKVLSSSTVETFLGAKYSGGEYFSSYLDDGTNKNIRSAIVNVDPDSDGKVRKYPYLIQYQGKCLVPLSDSLFSSRTKKNTDTCEKAQAYFRYPENIKTYSISDVILGNVGEDILRSSSVIVGATSLDLNDNFISLSGEKIPGVYVHGSMLISRLQNVEDKSVPATAATVLIMVSLLVGALCIVCVRKALLQIVSVFVVGAVTAIMSVLLFGKGIILPFLWLIAGLVLGATYSTLFLIVHEKKQGEYVRSLFSKYVNKDILQKLLSNKEALSFQGEKRKLTIMFSDLRGFTSLSENLPPEELMSLLNRYMTAMTKPILKYKGTIDKFIGDAVMAFWNAPIEIDNHEELAVQAAIDMQQALITFNSENNTQLQMGIGIHAGDAVVGNVGSQERMNYTALGDSVNLASRVEGLTKKYGVGIIITEQVASKLTQSLQLRKLDTVMVKGKNTATSLYEVLEPSHDIILIEKYENALREYQRGNIEVAKKLFEAIKDKDAPSALMYERLIKMEKGAPFDGVYVFEEK